MGRIDAFKDNNLPECSVARFPHILGPWHFLPSLSNLIHADPRGPPQEVGHQGQPLAAAWYGGMTQGITGDGVTCCT